MATPVKDAMDKGACNPTKTKSQLNNMATEAQCGVQISRTSLCRGHSVSYEALPPTILHRSSDRNPISASTAGREKFYPTLIVGILTFSINFHLSLSTLHRFQ
jgi:hypothetical protein